MNRFAAVMLMGLLVMGAAHAQVWKCTNSETGRVEYSGVPCSGRSLTGDRLNARPKESAGASSSSLQASRTQGAEAASAPRQNGGSAPAGDNAECTVAQNAYEAAKAKQAAPGVLQPLKNRASIACGRAPTGAGITQPNAQPNGPVGISSCDGSGCWDVNGDRYNATGGNMYSNAAGQSCQKSGNQLRCL